MPDTEKKYECYLNMTNVNGSQSRNIILSGAGETMEEARKLFNHAVKTLLAKFS